MQPLEGIRVLDLSANVAGPTCAMLLGDFGAEVIKVEPPTGDASRRWGSTRFGVNRSESSVSLAFNRNKQFVSIDLKNPEGTKVLIDLVKTSDVLLENFKTGVMERLGVGYEQVSKINDRLIYCSISGFGRTGPMKNRPGFDLLMQAYAGQLSITGEPGRPAVRIGPSSVDVLTGTMSAYAIAAALREREFSGKGQQIDASLYESALLTVSHMIVDYSATKKLSTRWGPFFPFIAPYGIFQAKDREFYIGISTDKMWLKFLNEVGWSDLRDDPRFKGTGDRARNQAELYEVFVPRIKERDAAEWIAMAEALDIPCSLIYDLSEVSVQEQALDRESIVPVMGYEEQAVSVGIPIKLSRTPATIRKGSGDLSIDTDRVLAGLGYSAEKIAELRDSKAIV
jgi:crotonobetainyl-CoA:carnitine CoA-transferase CaiB-like acyl-CoA transferase